MVQEPGATEVSGFLVKKKWAFVENNFFLFSGKISPFFADTSQNPRWLGVIALL